MPPPERGDVAYQQTRRGGRQGGVEGQATGAGIGRHPQQCPDHQVTGRRRPRLGAATDRVIDWTFDLVRIIEPAAQLRQPPLRAERAEVERPLGDAQRQVIETIVPGSPHQQAVVVRPDAAVVVAHRVVGRHLAR